MEYTPYPLNELMQALITCIVIATASSSVSITITQTELFLPLRNWVQRFGHMTGYLFKCFYCMAHWVVIAGMLVYHPNIIHSEWKVIDWIVTTFFTITLTTFVCGIMFKVFLLAMAKSSKEKEMKAASTQVVDEQPTESENLK